MKTVKTFIANLRSDFSRTSASAGIDPLLSAATVLLYIVLIGVVVGLVATMAGLASYVITENAALLKLPYDPVWRPVGRALLGFTALALVQAIIHHLLEMIRAVGRGEAFATDNVGRLERIAGHVLGLQIVGTAARILGLPVGGEIAGFDFGVSLSPAGVAFVLLLFILARVFRQGAAMREDLEGTV